MCIILIYVCLHCCWNVYLNNWLSLSRKKLLFYFELALLKKNDRKKEIKEILLPAVMSGLCISSWIWSSYGFLDVVISSSLTYEGASSGMMARWDMPYIKSNTG